MRWIYIILWICVGSYSVNASEFIGSASCASCHAQEYGDWQKSHHSKAMQDATVETVLGDFNNTVFKYGDVVTRFYSQSNKFFIETKDIDGRTQSYKVKYTFGFYPLQQYLVGIGKGKYQAYDVAWDSRPKEQGGQRWYKLRPNEDTSWESPFHWARPQQNWNSSCAECHSTNLNKNYNPIEGKYNTTFSEVSVGCESCHGAGSKHVELMRSQQSDDTLSGFENSLKSTRRFIFEGEAAVAKPDGPLNRSQIDVCGGCHSRRQIIGDISPNKNFHDQYRIRFLDQPLYQDDGQIQDEVFVLGSFLQSKMHDAGVVCSDCHNPHTGQVKAEGGDICAQCHLPEAYGTDEHYEHADIIGFENVTSSDCLTCHMPETTYMGVDTRRDHSFTLALFKDGEEDRFGFLNEAGQKGNLRQLPALVDFVNDETNSSMHRATLMTRLSSMPSRVSFETILKNIKSEDVLIRRAAVESTSFLSPENRWHLLKDMMEDPSTSVRFAVATQLARASSFALGTDLTQLKKLFEEYELQLKKSEDRPSGQTSLATFYLAQGKQDKAISHMKKALEIEPTYIPAILNMADFYRQTGQSVKAREALEQGISFGLEAAALYHSLGLHFIREKKMETALSHLKKAMNKSDSTARYGYVYAVALDSIGDTDQAIDILEATVEEWPFQYDTLFALLSYLEKENRLKEGYRHLSNLSAIAPSDPAVKRWIQLLK